MSEEINTKLRINVAALISPLVAIFQLLDTSCILNKLKPDVQRHGLYTYYIEMPNGSRMRQMADVVYDDRQVQFYFFHGFLIVFVLPGFFMPYLLYLAEKRMLIYLKGFEHFIRFDYWNLLNICQLGSTINSFGVPLKIYLSIFMIKHYQNIKNISPKASKNGSNSPLHSLTLLPLTYQKRNLNLKRIRSPSTPMCHRNANNKRNMSLCQ